MSHRGERVVRHATSWMPRMATNTVVADERNGGRS
jgi:hypothetical protein